MTLIVHRKFNFIISVNCEWDEWVIGQCSRECGGGKRINSRSIKVNATNGGTNCSGVSEITEICNIQECPGKKIFVKFFSIKCILSISFYSSIYVLN